MPIGYANFSNIAQGNQTIANNFASLGQQIGQSIENHAQLQAAQAMLPALQQSYTQGMQKIASGDPNGMADIYGAAATASQIPVLQGFAQHALTTAQSANINAQHMARTQAFLQGKTIGLMASHPEMYNPDGTLNTSRLGQPAPAKQPNAFQQMAAQKTGVQLQNTYQAQMDQAIKDNDPNAYASAAQGLANLNAQSAKTGLSPTGQPLSFDARQKANQLSTQLQAELAKPTGALHPSWFGGQNQTKIDDLSKQIQELHKDPKNLINVQPSMGQQTQSGGVDQNDILQQAVNAVRKKPSILPAVRARLQQNGVDPSLLDAAFKSQQTGQPQSVPQTSNMLPAVNSIASNQGPENQDESEAVEGGAEDSGEEKPS